MKFRSSAILPSTITPPEAYFNRRKFLAGLAASGMGTRIGWARAAVVPAGEG